MKLGRHGQAMEDLNKLLFLETLALDAMSVVGVGGRAAALGEVGTGASSGRSATISGSGRLVSGAQGGKLMIQESTPLAPARGFRPDQQALQQLVNEATLGGADHCRSRMPKPSFNGQTKPIILDSGQVKVISLLRRTGSPILCHTFIYPAPEEVAMCRLHPAYRRPDFWSRPMLPQDLSSRLREHSGLPVSTPQLEGSSFIDKVQAVQDGEPEVGLEDAVMDVVECLQRLNRHSQSMPENRGDVLNLEVVYAISGMTLLAIEVSMTLLKKRKDCSKLLMAAWQIGCAWDALLAGDIEDIHQHLINEAIARGLS